MQNFIEILFAVFYLGGFLNGYFMCFDEYHMRYMWTLMNKKFLTINSLFECRDHFDKGLASEI